MHHTVRIDRVSKSYGRTTALDGVTFDVTGGITGLLGPNGAGKTTLLRILATIASPDRGSVEVLGDPQLLILDEPTTGLDPELRLRFRDLVSRIGEHRTVLLSTRQTEDVAALCTDVVVMHQGQTRFQGTPHEPTIEDAYLLLIRNLAALEDEAA